MPGHLPGGWLSYWSHMEEAKPASPAERRPQKTANETGASFVGDAVRGALGAPLCGLCSTWLAWAAQPHNAPAGLACHAFRYSHRRLEYGYSGKQYSPCEGRRSHPRSLLPLRQPGSVVSDGTAFHPRWWERAYLPDASPQNGQRDEAKPPLARPGAKPVFSSWVGDCPPFEAATPSFNSPAASSSVPCAAPNASFARLLEP